MRTEWPTAAEAVAEDLPGPAGLRLAESPRVSADGRTLWFVDISDRRLWRAPIARLHDRAAYVSRELPAEPGFVAPDPAAPESPLVGFPDGLFRVDWATGERELVCAVPPAEAPVRINDGAVAPDGSVWFGTMNLGAEDAPAGTLFRVAAGDGAAGAGAAAGADAGMGAGAEAVAQALDGPAACWNGIGWSPDGAVAYATDTLGGEIRSYTAQGEPLGRIPVPGAGAEALPDGLLVDRSGALWSAIWGGSVVLRLRPESAHAVRCVGAIRVAGARPTALAELPDGGLVITRAADAAGSGALAHVPVAAVARLREAEE